MEGPSGNDNNDAGGGTGKGGADNDGTVFSIHLNTALSHIKLGK